MRAAAAGPLPVPTQAYVTFGRDFFSIAVNDSHSGNHADLFDAFNVDPNNPAGSSQPQALRERVAAAGAALTPLVPAYICNN